MKTRFIDTKPYTYSTLCETYRKFSMPHNQRPYAWKSQHISELWDAIVENEEGYFIGNLVGLGPSEDSGDSLVIVDGQQRLTTISLFLVAFRNVLMSGEQSKINTELTSLLNEYLFWRNPRTQLLVGRLRPGKDNLATIYDSFLQSGTEDDFADAGLLDGNQKRYVSNLKYIQSLVKKEVRGKKRAK